MHLSMLNESNAKHRILDVQLYVVNAVININTHLLQQCNN